jgi:hypothetical protein
MLESYDPLATNFHVAGRGFLRAGMDHMHKNRWGKGAWVQPAVANMTVGIELLCKSFLSGENPLLIFNRVEPEVAWAVHQRGFGFDQVPYERIHTLIEAGGTRTIGLSECIKLLQARFPAQVQSLGEWGRRLAGWRAVCVHFVLPDVGTLAVRRVAFAALSLAALLSDQSNDVLRKFSLTDDDKRFLDEFDRDKAEDLDKRLRAAKKKVKDMQGRVMIGLLADDGTELTCEVCGNDGIAFGERSVVEGYEMLFLSEFTCDECGLKLFDASEMQECGFETVHEIGPYEVGYH